MLTLKKSNALVVAIGAYAVALLFVFGCSQASDPEESEVPVESTAVPARTAMDWKNPQTCLACHANEHSDWVDSHHALANRLVDPSIDGERFAVGEFQDLAGRTYRVENEDGRMAISEQNADGDFVAVEAKAVIGTTPLQQPLVEGEGGRWQAHAMAWDPAEEEWFNVFGGEERLVGEWGHWTGQGMNWNSNCAWCHMTEYDKNFDALENAYASTWTQQGISCIACHSGMEEHVATAGLATYVAPPKSDKKAIMENCASCHARREELTDGNFEAGDRFSDHYRLMLYDHPTAYFPDGKANEENFVYGSFVHSKMGHAGVSCMDCHNPHSNELTLPAQSNATCIQCHSTGNLGASVIDLNTHSRHPIGSTGDSCVECHMPERVYMARDPRRDHGFTIPDPYMAKEFGAPDACSNCHQDLGTDELLEHFDAWWGNSARVKDLRDRAHLLQVVWDGALDSPDAILQRLAAEPNPYWKASWMRMLTPFSDLESVKIVAEENATAEEAILRDAALQVLSRRPDALALLQDGLQDPRRLVRMRAADTLAGTPYLTPELNQEHDAYLQANADRPTGALRIASKAADAGDVEKVRQYSNLAIGHDRKNGAIRYDVAILYDRVGLAAEAIQHLRVAHGYDPSTGLYLFSIGLLQAGQGNLAEAAESLQRALRIEPNQHRWLFNLAVIQVRLGDVLAARASLERALQLAPDEESYKSFQQQLGG